jgi:hypothetical protein
MTKKKTKFVWAGSTAIDALRPYVREVLGAMAEATGQPGVAHAMVSDESWLSDFLPFGCFGSPDKLEEWKGRLKKRIESETDPKRKSTYERRLAMCEGGPTREEVEAAVKSRFKELGIDVELRDCVYEVAIRLRDR